MQKYEIIMTGTNIFHVLMRYEKRKMDAGKENQAANYYKNDKKGKPTRPHGFPKFQPHAQWNIQKYTKLSAEKLKNHKEFSVLKIQLIDY